MSGIDSSSPASSPAPYSVPEEEAMFYYSGLPSAPILVYRSGTTPWTASVGPEAYRVLRLRPVFNHKSNAVWPALGPQLCDLLDSYAVLCSTIDVVRFVKVGQGEAIGPVVLWIGVHLDTLLGEVAHASAIACLDLLKKHDISDVEVEYRESVYFRSASPSLLTPVGQLHPTVDVHTPLTLALRLSIAAQETPYAEGTGVLYIAQGGTSTNVLLLTPRHVLLPSNETLNADYTRTKGFESLVKSITNNIGECGDAVEVYEDQIAQLRQAQLTKLQVRRERARQVPGAAGLDKGQGEEYNQNEPDAGDDSDSDSEGEGDVTAMAKLKKLEQLMNDEKEAIEALVKFRDIVEEQRTNTSNRVIGHIVHSPRIALGVGPERFTEDYAVVELGQSKIKNGFRGDVIDLGTKLSPTEFKEKMYSMTDAGVTKVRYPSDRLLKLRDIIPEEDMRQPDTRDRNGEPCLPVIKSGHATGVTIGRANGIFSFVRTYTEDLTHQTSMEWPILPYDSKSGVFSAPGDSGSVIADGRGRIGGLLTGGSGKAGSSVDIAYATPFWWLFPRIKASGIPDAL